MDFHDGFLESFFKFFFHHLPARRAAGRAWDTGTADGDGISTATSCSKNSSSTIDTDTGAGTGAVGGMSISWGLGSVPGRQEDRFGEQIRIHGHHGDHQFGDGRGYGSDDGLRLDSGLAGGLGNWLHRSRGLWVGATGAASTGGGTGSATALTWTGISSFAGLLAAGMTSTPAGRRRQEPPPLPPPGPLCPAMSGW